MEFLHYPVMHDEVLEYLTLPKDRESVIIDCTTGEGGHSKMMLDNYPLLTVIGLDRDREIQQKAIERLKSMGSAFVLSTHGSTTISHRARAEAQTAFSSISVYLYSTTRKAKGGFHSVRMRNSI